MSEESTSSPPPLPKMPPTSEAVASRSVTFHCSGRPTPVSPLGVIAAYSPGSICTGVGPFLAPAVGTAVPVASAM